MFSMAGKVMGIVTQIRFADVEFSDGIEVGGQFSPKPYGGRVHPGADGKQEILDWHPLAYNAGLAYAVPIEYAVQLLKKNGIGFK
jgi:hypothetical protein